MIYIVPTRGRPHKARELVAAWDETKAYATLIFAVDEDDPCRDEYYDIAESSRADVYDVPEGVSQGGMVGALNYVAQRHVNDESHHWIGFMGDDHRPQTTRWDFKLARVLTQRAAKIGYANDLVQGANLPTAVLMERRVVQRLGYMAPPVLRHLYVDNYWRDLGKAADCLYYESDIIIAHEHPITGKVEWDEGYRRVNDGAMYTRDGAAYRDFVTSGDLAADIAKIRTM